MLPDDELALREVIKSTIESGELRRDMFGLNPGLVGFQTAELAEREIGLKRDGVIATLMYSCVINGQVDVDTIGKRFGDNVHRIINGLVRIHELYQKNPVIESENFRNLLLSFAEDMRVILIMIADRVNLMRQIRETSNEEARHEVSEEASYLYAPLAHKLGLYK